MENLPPDTSTEKLLPVFERFPRTSLIFIVLLTLATLGFYVPYWLYTRTRILNQLLPNNPIPSLLIAMCMGGYIMLLALVYQLPADMNTEQIMNSPQFSHLMNAAMLLNLVQLAWAMLFLQRVNICTAAQTTDALYGSYFLLVLAHLFIVNIYYLQYKINQIADSKPSSTIGLM